jgi:hypothetical protein
VACVAIVVRLLIIVRVFVEGVVRQMDEDVVHVSLVWPFIRLCAKSCKGALVKVDSQRGNTVQEHVNPQVIFE